jgi:hypothetical protein
MDKLTQQEAIDTQRGLMVLAVDVLMKKRKDYSGDDDPFSNLRVAEHHGVHPVVGTNIRANDKLARTSRIVQSANGVHGLVGESVIDDLRDIINYAAISAGLLAEEYPDVKETLLAAAENFDQIMLNFKSVSHEN